jgi:HSP20 family protein
MLQRTITMPRDEANRWMWLEATAVVARAERLHRQYFHIALSTHRTPVWEPPVDVLETPEQLVIIVALPGVDPQSIKSTIENGNLSVIGSRLLPAALNAAVIHRLELPHGRFERRVSLPSGHYGEVRSAIDNGCLIVTLDKVL